MATADIESKFHFTREMLAGPIYRMSWAGTSPM
jgi:hypothetical protein